MSSMFWSRVNQPRGRGNLRLHPGHWAVTEMWTNGSVGVETASVQSMPEGLTPLIVGPVKTSAVRENCGKKKNDSPNKTRRKKRKPVWSRVEQGKTPLLRIWQGTFQFLLWCFFPLGFKIRTPRSMWGNYFKSIDIHSLACVRHTLYDTHIHAQKRKKTSKCLPVNSPCVCGSQWRVCRASCNTVHLFFSVLLKKCGQFMTVGADCWT